jgi:hypothetical protein
MNNPVAWQLWGDEAIELAKKENKLLFVSIGYSACHCKPRNHCVIILVADIIRVPCYGKGIIREQ